MKTILMKTILQTDGVSLGDASAPPPLVCDLSVAALIYGIFYGSRKVLIGMDINEGGSNNPHLRVGGAGWMATLMHFPLPCNLCTSISRTISPPLLSLLFNCHIITIIIRAVNKRQGRRQTCHINQGITSTPSSSYCCARHEEEGTATNGARHRFPP